MTESVVEVFYKGTRVASHHRAYRKGQMVTDPLHRPKSHQKHMEWTPSRLIQWGASSGPSTGKLIETILAHKPHPEQGYRSCLGIISLSKKYSAERLEAAAARAVTIGSFSYTSVKSILERGMEQLELPLFIPETPTPAHENVRGATYYKENRSSRFIH